MFSGPSICNIYAWSSDVNINIFAIYINIINDQFLDLNLPLYSVYYYHKIGSIKAIFIVLTAWYKVKPNVTKIKQYL